MSIPVELKEEVSGEKLWTALKDAADKVGANATRTDIVAKRRLVLESVHEEKSVHEHECTVKIPVQKSKGFFVRPTAIICNITLTKRENNEIELAVTRRMVPGRGILTTLATMACLVAGGIMGVVFGTGWMDAFAGIMIGVNALGLLLGAIFTGAWILDESAIKLELGSSSLESVRPQLYEYLEEVSKTLDSSSILDSCETTPRLLTG